MRKSIRKPFRLFPVCLSLAAIIAAAPVVHAEKGGKGKGHGNSGAAHGNKGGQGKVHGGGPGSHGNSGKGVGHSNAGVGNAGGKGHGAAKKFDSGQRAAISGWYRDNYRDGNCPPGLAKKNNGCMPPGQARKWSVGSTLPSDIVISPVPSGLLSVLSSPYDGYSYGWVDGGVVLYSVETRIVVDFVAPF